VVLLFVVRGRTRLIAVGVLGMTALLSLVLAWGAIVDYFVRDEPTTQLTTLNTRTQFWAVALEAYRQEPVFGYGLASSRGLFVEETGLGGGHNALVNVLVELGLVGTTFWVAMVMATIVAAVRARHRMPPDGLIDRAIVLGIVAFLLLDGIFYEGAGAPANVGATWLLACVGWVTLMSTRRQTTLSWIARRQALERSERIAMTGVAAGR
jgi:exopolysaccharide production protein ExoQ